eukprot:jgi/Psemu1/64268/estExt_Genemark1.C_580018
MLQALRGPFCGLVGASIGAVACAAYRFSGGKRFLTANSIGNENGNGDGNDNDNKHSAIGSKERTTMFFSVTPSQIVFERKSRSSCRNLRARWAHNTRTG